MARKVDQPHRDPSPPWGIDAPKQDPNDVGADWVPRLQGPGIGAARKLNDFLGSNSPSDRRQQDQEFQRVREAWAVKGTDGNVGNLEPENEMLSNESPHETPGEPG